MELEQINEAFNSRIELGSNIKLFLKRGLDLEYDDNYARIKIIPAKKLIFGMERKELEGTLMDSTFFNKDNGGVLGFIINDEKEDRYYLKVNHSQIDSYRILYKHGESFIDFFMRECGILSNT